MFMWFRILKTVVQRMVKVNLVIVILNVVITKSLCASRATSLVNYSVEDLRAGQCLCVTAHRLNARNNGGLFHNVLYILKKGSCYPYSGHAVNRHGYTWLKLHSPKYNTMWAAGKYLKAEDDEKCINPCSSYGFVTREEWGARPPKSTSYMKTPVDLVFIHHTAGNQCLTQESCSSTMRGIQNYHMDDRGWDDIGYNFLIGGDGSVYEGRGWNRVGAHTKGYNDRSIAISLMGNYMTENPSQLMLQTVEQLIQCGISQGKIRDSYSLHGHRDVRCTDCPGDALYSILNEWSHWHQQDLPLPQC